MSKELYTNDSIYVVPIGDNAMHGFWVIPCQGGEAWQYESVDSLFYDAVHQNIYRNRHDYDRIDFESVKETLPELPTSYEYKRTNWADNFPEVIFNAEIYPNIYQKLVQEKEQKLAFWIVLYENGYESRFGDGVFLYYHKVFPTEELAEAYCLAYTKDYSYYYAKKKEVFITDGKVDFNKAKPQYHPDRYDLNVVLRDLEDCLSDRDV
jgi:hypothetical protein